MTTTSARFCYRNATGRGSQGSVLVLCVLAAAVLMLIHLVEPDRSVAHDSWQVPSVSFAALEKGVLLVETPGTGAAPATLQGSEDPPGDPDSHGKNCGAVTASGALTSSTPAITRTDLTSSIESAATCHARQRMSRTADRSQQHPLVFLGVSRT